MKKTLVVKQGEEVLLVWMAHNITRRKLKAGIYTKHPAHKTLTQTYRRANTSPKSKYRYEIGYAENVICKIIRK